MWYICTSLNYVSIDDLIYRLAIIERFGAAIFIALDPS